MRDLLQAFVQFTYVAHERILSLNDAFEARLSDKELHFIIFGLVGTAVFALAWSLFHALRRHIGCSAWLFALMAITILALAVEVGQGLSGTGSMEMADIVWGVAGFAAFSAAMFLIVSFARALARLFRGEGGKGRPRRR